MYGQNNRILRIMVSIVLISLIQLSLAPTFAQNRQLERQPVTADSQKRVALVIGNAAYTKAKPLANPANDAADMSAALRSLGFDLVYGVNQNKREIETLIRDFGTKLAASGGVGLFYYAGHGLQVAGENYIVPVDADIPEEDEVQYSAVPISLVLAKMSSAKNELNIVILDACRNNPFARSWRGFRDSGNSDGLAKISPPTGTLVLYATEPGKVASDGTGRNGLFTESLLKQIKQPGLEYDQMVKALSTDVWARSGKQQLPWKEGNALQNFYFAGKAFGDQNITVKTEAQQEREAWDLVKNSNDPGDLRIYLKEFPNGANYAAARIRLEDLVWQSAKASTDKAAVQAYLDEFPNGANSAAAKIRLRQLESDSAVTTPNAIPTGVLKAGTVRKSPSGIELVWIPPGEFLMGSPDSEKGRNDDEGPQRKIAIRNGFWMGKFEVTQRQWEAVMGSNPSTNVRGPDYPVNFVRSSDIQEFIKRLNSLDPELEYRLPSEAEWEYACRAGTTTAYAFGESLDSTQANLEDRTVPVGSYRPNAWGLYDMHGNVAEWVEDSYSPNHQTQPADGSAVKNSNWGHVLKGGRSAQRGGLEAVSMTIGFRIAAHVK